MVFLRNEESQYLLTECILHLHYFSVDLLLLGAVGNMYLQLGELGIVGDWL